MTVVNLSLVYYWVMGGAVKCTCKWRSSTNHLIINYFTTRERREREREIDLMISSYSIFSFMSMFCRSLFVHFYFFFWPLCRLFFFDIRIMVTHLVSSSSSCFVDSIDEYTFSLTCFVIRHSMDFAEGFLPISDPKSVSQVCCLTIVYKQVARFV
jgi:hypothetical protein